MKDRKRNFTKDFIASLPLPSKGKRCSYYDTKSRGLGVCIFPSGKKTFFVYRKIDGKPERIKIGDIKGSGDLKTLSIENIRDKADAINALIGEGGNPAQNKRLGKAELTLGELFEEYLKRHAKLHKSSWREDERQYNYYLLPWKQRKLSSIRKTDIQKLHHEIGRKNGTYAANRLLALISSLFNRANEFGLWDKTNPADGIKKFKEKSRSRFLQADELPRFFKALSEEPNETARDYILLSLLTGARKSNMLAMRWDEINFELGLWNIPKTKNGESHTIPLVSQALEILKDRFANKINEWVFPSSSKSGHFSDPKKPWKRTLERADISNLRIHDLRRSLGSWQASTGASLAIIGKTLAHKNVATTAIYARLNIDPVRDAMNKATQAIWDAGSITSPESEHNIISIKKINAV
jgi:integrase